MIDGEKKPYSAVFNGDFEVFVDIVTDSYDNEVMRVLEPIASQKIVEWFIGKYHVTNIAAFFNLRHLKELTEEVQKDNGLWMFLMGVTDRVSLQTLVVRSPSFDPVMDSIVRALVRTKDQPDTDNYSLVPKELRSELYTKGDTLNTLLVNNYWLIILYILIVFFEKTQAYTAIKNPQS